MAERRLQRAISAVYLPEAERWSHYFRTSLAKQFDWMIRIDRTRALQPLEPGEGGSQNIRYGSSPSFRPRRNSAIIREAIDGVPTSSQGSTMTMNLDKLSPAELQALIRTAEAKMDSARKTQIQDVRSKIDSILKNACLTIGEVYPQRGRAGKGTKATVAPKYRNPADASQTWSGRGKRPIWFIEALKKRGVTPESLLIDGSAPKTVAAKKAVRKSAKKARAKTKA